VHAQVINRVEYYFDTDPGFGNGASIPITPAIDITQNFTIPLSTLSEGFHLMHLRAKSNGLWSLPNAKPVFVQRGAQTATVLFINRVEYFFDADPGLGNGIAIPITSAVDVTQSLGLPLNSIADGFHILYFRARTTDGRWSIPVAKTVFVQQNAQSTITPLLKKIEYFFDVDPGVGNGTTIALSTSSIDQLVTIDLSAVPTGFHLLYMRSQDVNNQWSLLTVKPFFVQTSRSNIVAVDYYFFDGTTKSAVKTYTNFTPAKNLTLDFAAVLDGLLPNTSYQIHLTAINITGQRSTEVVHTFVTPAVICDPITPPNVVDASMCGNGSVDLLASGAAGSQLYAWYQTPTGGVALVGETTGLYSTPVLNDTTTYYVAIQNGTCESNRTQVTAFINPILTAPSTINSEACGVNSTVTLTATGGNNGEYRWYAEATGGTTLPGEVNDTFITPPLSATTIFYVSLDNGSCESSRTAVTAILNPVPPQPSITSSISLIGNALTICGSTILTLSAPSGFAGYLWSDGATTQSITVNVSGTYTVTVTDLAGCASSASEAAAITLLPGLCANEAPEIVAVALSTIIEGQVTVNLIPLITDADDNLDLTSLAITQQPASGAIATITNGVLQINYAGVNFSGTDQLTIQVCDVFGACATQVLEIVVIGDIEIFNGVSPGNDGKVRSGYPAGFCPITH